MRKSSIRSRLLQAGIATAGIVAVVLASTAAPALAAGTITISPTSGVTGQTGTITATGNGGPLFTSTTGVPGALFTTLSSCPGTYATTAPTGVVNAVAAKSGNDAAVITLPATLVPGAYLVCVYATATAGAAVAHTGSATYTVTPAPAVLNPATGVPGGVTTITATGTGTTFLTTAPTVGVNLSTSTCAATYTSAVSATNLVATATRTTSVATITLPSPLLAGTAYNVCLYGGTADGVSPLLGNGSTTYAATATAQTLSPTTGPSGGTNSIIVTAATSIFSGTVGVNFVTGSCPATYAASPTNLATTATVNSGTVVSITVPAGVVAATSPYRVCTYSGVVDATSTLIGASTLTYVAALPTVTLSATTGKTGGGNTITGQAPTNFLNGIPAPGVVFTTTTCPTVFPTPTTLTATGQRIALNRLAVTVPSGVTGSTAFKVCVYDGTTPTTSALIGSAASYTAATETTLASVSPAAGPALGGSTITVTGAGFPATIISASLGGSPLTSIQRTSATTFTAVTPPHLAGSNLTLSVVTSAGTFTLRNAFTYTNGIVISPNTAPSGTPRVDVYVVGVGFSTPTFSSTLGDAHIYLVDGKYDGADNAGQKVNGPVAECKDVLVISDTELICNIALDHRLAADGTYAAAATRAPTDGVSTNTSTTFTSATANFTSADIGLGLAATGIPASTTIVSVTSPTSVVLSAAATATATGLTTTIGGSRAVATVGTASGSTTLTGSGVGQFKPADVGRPVTGTGIPLGATIVSVDATGTTATISVAATATASVTATVAAAAPVLDGAYTMTFVTNGAIDAVINDTEYSQSIITSGSTFTVADY